MRRTSDGPPMRLCKGPARFPRAPDKQISGESRRQGDLPVGVSNPFCDFAVKPHSRKYSYLRPGRRSSGRLMSCPERGALAIVTNVGMGCGGRGSVGRVIAIAGRFYVSDHAARGRTALQRLRQDFGPAARGRRRDWWRLLRTAKPCGPGTRCWCQAGGGCSNPTGFRSTVNSLATVTRRIRRRGEHGISR